METKQKIQTFGALANIARSFFAPTPQRKSAEESVVQGSDITEGAATSLPPLQVSASSGAGAFGGDGNFSGSTIGLKQGDWNVTTGSGDTGLNMKWMAIAAAVGVYLAYR